MGIMDILLVIHISAGFVALFSGVGASMVKQWRGAHAWHQRWGNSFFFSMVVIFITAFPMAALSQNFFLLFISLFSMYFAYSGWRYAKNITGRADKQDVFVLCLMVCVCIAMLFYGAFLWGTNDDGNGITLVAFSIIGFVAAGRNFITLRSGSAVGSQRIAEHATMMLAGCIATVTAFAVTNFTSDPVYLLWLLPTVVITPYIIYWNIFLLSTQKK
jgi:cation transport ATPase